MTVLDATPLRVQNTLRNHFFSPVTRSRLEKALALSLLALITYLRWHTGRLQGWNALISTGTLSALVLVILLWTPPQKVVFSPKTILAVGLCVLPSFLNGPRPVSPSPWLLQGGFALRVFYDLLLVSSYLSLGRNFGLFPGMRGVTTGGPYRFLRHPIYGSSLHRFTAEAVILPDPTHLLLILILATGFLMRIKEEEKLLASSPQYQRYRVTVPTVLFHPLVSLPLGLFGILKIWIENF